MLRFSRKIIKFKAKSIYDKNCGDNEELKAGLLLVIHETEQTFYVKTNNNSATTIDPSHLTTKLIKYVMHV